MVPSDTGFALSASPHDTASRQSTPSREKARGSVGNIGARLTMISLKSHHKDGHGLIEFSALAIC